MRWKTAENFDRRIKTGFLILPKKLDNEWRWLERASWEQEYYDGFWWSDHWIEE